MYFYCFKISILDLGPLLQWSKHPLASTYQYPRAAQRMVWEAIQALLANQTQESAGV